MGLSQLDENIHTVEWMGWSDADAANTNNVGMAAIETERRIDSILCNSNDTVVYVIRFQLISPVISWIEAFDIHVPIGAGVTTPLFQGLPAILQGPQGGLILPRGWQVQAHNLAVSSAGKLTAITILGGYR